MAAGAVIDSALLLRKYNPYAVIWYEEKIAWKHSVSELRLQGSNHPSFRPSRDLLRVGTITSTHVQTLPVAQEQPYRYYRLARPDTTAVWLATLRLHGDRDYKTARARTREDTLDLTKLEDTDPLSYLGGKEFEVWYDFGEPVRLEALELQVRNDDNHIRPGDVYELMYWDKGWRSLGRRVARDTMLVYRKVPAGALYWLRNHSRGKEECVFTITKEGKQWWPGVSGYPLPLPWMESVTKQE